VIFQCNIQKSGVKAKLIVEELIWRRRILRCLNCQCLQKRICEILIYSLFEDLERDPAMINFTDSD